MHERLPASGGSLLANRAEAAAFIAGVSAWVRTEDREMTRQWSADGRTQK